MAIACVGGPRPEPVPELQPGERPAPGTDEGGLWMQADQAELALRASPLLVKDKNLDAYLRGILDRVAGSHRDSLRVYVLEAPEFGAFTLPNGIMIIFTGLLLRAINEAQLAFAVAHEVTHYVRRHGLLLFRDARAKAASGAFLLFLSGDAAAIDDRGELASSLARGGTFEFSQDQEREADDGGFGLLEKAGYEPREATRLFEGILKESGAQGRKDRTSFSTHPATAERLARLRERAGKVAPGGSRELTVGQERHWAVVLPLRRRLLQDEFRLPKLGPAEVLLERLFATQLGLGELHFFRGELHRLRGKDADLQRAIADYRKAIELGGAPPETPRALGLLYMKTGDKPNARVFFDRYLRENPEAGDADMVRHYLRQLD